MDAKKFQGILDKRTTTSFGVSIGTGLMLESLFSPTQPRYDDMREIPEKVHLNKYNGWIINIYTLIRNILGSLTEKIDLKDVSKENLKQILAVVREEIYIIQSLVMSSGDLNSQYVRIFIPKYDDLFEKFNRGKNMEKGTGVKNAKTGVDLFKKLIDKDEYKASLNSFILEPKYGYKIDKDYTNNVLITKSFSLDLLQDLNMTLLESHTGVLKTQPQFYTKFSKSSNDYSPIPFNDLTLFLLGDTSLVKGWSAKVKTKISSVATEKKWTYRTTKDKVKADLIRDIELNPLISIFRGF